MTVLFMDSANGFDALTKWTQGNPGGNPTSGSVSNRGYYTLGDKNGHVLFQSIPPTSSVLVGYYLRIQAGFVPGDGATSSLMLQLGSPSGTHLTFNVNGIAHTAMGPRWRLGGGNGTLIAQSATDFMASNTWYYVEHRATLADSGGRIETWVDGVQVVNYTGDTRNGGSDTQWTTVRIGRTSINRGDATHYSDIVISDGTTPNGPAMVWLSLPNGNGNQTQLTGSDGNQVDNYLMVDETTPDGDSTYVHGNTEGDYDLYQLTNLPAGSWNVRAVQTTFQARRAEPGVRFMRPVLRTNGTDYPGTSVVLAESYTTNRELWNQNPVTVAPWSSTEYNDLQIGPEVRDS